MKRFVFALLVACSGSSKPAPDLAGVPSQDPQPTTPAPQAPVAKGNPRNDLIPRQLLFGNPERTGVQISPDGKHVAWLAPSNGVMNIWVAPVGKLEQAKAITSEASRPIRQYAWAFTNKHLVYKQDAGGDENFHVYRVDVAGGAATDLTPGKPAQAEIAGLSPEKPTTLLVMINDRNPQAMDLQAIDLVTGKRALVAQNDDGFLGYTVDSKLRPVLTSKKTPDGATQYLRAETKAGKLAWTAWDTVAFEDADTSEPSIVSADGKRIYWKETRRRDTAALVEIDLATKKAKVLAENAKADAGDIVEHPTKHTIQAIAFEYDRVQWKILDKSIEKDLAALAKLDGGEVEITSRSLDDKTWIVFTHSDVSPGRYYLWERVKQKSTLLFAARPELEKQPLVKMWPVEIKARDGLTLVGYLTLPKDADANGDGKADKPVPMILAVHGGPWGRDSWGFNRNAQLQANRGYAVLQVNFRGSTGFGKKFINAANLQWGKAMHDDLLDAVQWAVDQKVTAKDTVCIMGGSYGGYATLVGMTMTPDVFRCGVDVVGPSNLLTFMASIPAYWAPALAVLHTRVGNPESADGKAALTAASPLTHVARIKRPLLIAQGKNDPRVKEAESEQIVAAMKKAKLPVTYVVFPDEGHGFQRPANNIAFTAVVEAFLSVNLGGAYQPITSEELKASSMEVRDGKASIPGL